MSSCGTGLGSVTLPGDPSFTVSVSAAAVFNGIKVSWTYPSTNPNAVAYYEVYRANSTNFATASEIAKTSSNFYIDTSSSLTGTSTYYYWIVVVSLQGTRGAANGPASTSSVDAIGQIIDDLSGKITASKLHTSLNSRINAIGAIEALLVDKTLLTQIDYEALLEAVAQAQEDFDGLNVVVQEEVVLRAEGDAVVLSAIDTLGLGLGDNSAALQEEVLIRISEDEALALSISNLSSTVGGNTAAISTESLARTNADSALTSQITTLSNTITHPTTGLSAVGTVASGAKIQADITDGIVTTLSSDFSTVQSTVNNPSTGLAATAAIASNAETTASIAADGVVELNAQYTIKTDANGHVAGFGLANTPSTDDGTNTSSMEILVDQFSIVEPANYWQASQALSLDTLVQPTIPDKVTNSNLVYKVISAGTTGGSEPSWPSSNAGTVSNGSVTFKAFPVNKTVPFIVDNGSVYIRNASIQDAAITSAKIANSIQSNDYDPGEDGWKINKDGTAEFNNITARGTIIASSVIADSITTSSLTSNSVSERYLQSNGPSTTFTEDIWNSVAVLALGSGIGAAAFAMIRYGFHLINTASSTEYRYHLRFIRYTGTDPTDAVEVYMDTSDADHGGTDGLYVRRNSTTIISNGVPFAALTASDRLAINIKPVGAGAASALRTCESFIEVVVLKR